MAIASIGIYPPIGIARVGNSTKEWFYGPEVPGRLDTPKGGFKDADLRVKRQAQRFRVYAFNAQGQVIGEINSSNGYKLKWSVRVANKKASWYNFQGKFEGAFKTPTGLRNPTVQPDVPPEKRTKLIVDSGVVSVEGVSAPAVPLAGQFYGSFSQPTEVYLGEIFTDEKGRLVVLGGRGFSHHVGLDPYPLLMNDFDSPDWIDDTSDGWVNVSVEKDGIRWNPPIQSWVVCTTPKFAAAIFAPTSLYDLIEDILEKPKRRAAGEKYDVGDVEYYVHIEPLLRRAPLLSWVNGQANRGHGPSGPGYFLSQAWQKELSDPSPKSEQTRKQVLGRIRLPSSNSKYDSERAGQAFPYFMPWLSGDGGRTTDGNPSTFSSLTELQYDRLVKWANGNFSTKVKPLPPPASIEQINIQLQPGALTQASLEWTIGLPLYPGIEMSWPAELEESYETGQPFRVARSTQPGDITKYLSLPWQSDFYMCRNYWWPSARPDAIVPESEFNKVRNSANPAEHLNDRVPWERGLHLNHTDQYGDQPLFANTDMAKNWHQLGFIVRAGGTDNEPIFVESQRGTIDHGSQPASSSSSSSLTASAASTLRVALPKPASKEHPITTIESLREHLQTAILVELSTIPLYLFAMYSIKDPHPNDPRAVNKIADVIRHVVAEEMLHLSLAGNVLLAIGGTPRVYNQLGSSFVPQYPMYMIGHDKNPPVILNLFDAKKNLDTFLQIELPEEQDAPPQPDEYHTIGQFYAAIEAGIYFLSDKQNIFAEPKLEFQFAPGLGYNPRVRDSGSSIVVHDVESAIAALKTIVVQGEGAKDPPSDEPSHYQAFKKLKEDTGDHIQCWPVKQNPVTNQYTDPHIRQVSRAFDAAYSYLLLVIEKLWTIQEGELRQKLVLSNMFGLMMGVLAPLAKFLVQQPIDQHTNAAPAFNYYAFGPHASLSSAFRLVQQELQRAIDSYVSYTEQTPTQVPKKDYGAQLEALLPILNTLTQLYQPNAKL